MFSEKLNYIMNITRTQASALGKVCNLDPSYISRLRGGSRALPKRPEFLYKMTSYLAGRVVSDYQKGAMCDAMKITSFPEDKKRAAKLIGKWLCAGDEVSSDISALLDTFSNPKPGGEISDHDNPRSAEPKNCYYGADGKREAVLQFFDMILREKEPRTLLLLSDEDMEWLSEDPVFSARWIADFTRVLMKGNRVKIIHNIGRSMNEMLEAVSKWIPVYTTGMIEPYYYPKLRDRIFRRTLFIAPGTAAIVSASVEQNTDGMLNQLITDRDAISALSKEFENYLSLCRPLMSISTVETRGELWKAYHSLMSAEGDLICMSDMPTLATMPEHVARSMQERAPESTILEEWTAIKTLLKKRRKTHYTEILPKFSADKKNAPLPCADLLGAPGMCYTKEEWEAHISSSAKIDARRKLYSQIVKTDIPKNICLFVKEGRGVIMTKTNSPGAAFAFSESNMVGSFTDYIKRYTEKTEK